MVFGSKSIFDQVISVLVNPPYQIIGNSGVEHISIFVSHHIDEICHFLTFYFYLRGDCHGSSSLAMTVVVVS